MKATLSSESGLLDEVHSVSRVGSALPQRRGHFQEERKDRTDQRIPQGDYSGRGSAGYTIPSGKGVSRIRSPSSRDQLRDDFGRQKEPRTEQTHRTLIDDKRRLRHIGKDRPDIRVQIT